MILFLFTTDLGLAKKAEESGIDSIIVDWENKGKDTRQVGYQLETNFDSPEDVYKLSKTVHIPITMRLNCLDSYTKDEVECALKNGARILMLPMARTSEEVQEFLDIVRGRAKTLIQIETKELVSNVEKQ